MKDLPPEEVKLYFETMLARMYRRYRGGDRYWFLPNKMKLEDEREATMADPTFEQYLKDWEEFDGMYFKL